ncbi:MAG: aminotransferase class I/II-fold pyridoxal phosphate-dependent enzyme [Acidimicrobiia bacterium]|nr:aminotransferase class I/II-fold pyridoxal phosphate-dependent enzyme [Acidimicrobiia bacterium]
MVNETNPVVPPPVGSGGFDDQPETRSVEELRRLDAIKWNRYDETVLPVWVADMDLAPPRFVVDALVEFARGRDYGYNFAAVEKLPAAFTAWQWDHHRWIPERERVKVFCDVLHAIDVAIWLHTEPGDGIALLTPIYPPFIRAVAGVDRRIVDVPLDPANGWRLDPDRLDQAIDGGTRVLLLCNPHNPTGRVFDDDERRAIADIVVEHDLLLISDEVWGDLLHPGVEHRPMALMPELADRILTVSSASKSFNLAGLRCAVAHIGHEGLGERLDDLPPHFLGAVGIPGATAALRCWTDGQSWLSATRRYLTARRDQLAAVVEAELPDIGFQVPEATYLAWLDLSRYELDPNPSKWLIDNAGIACNAGTEFGPWGEGFVRLNFATSEAILTEVLDRLVTALLSKRP